MGLSAPERQHTLRFQRHTTTFHSLIHVTVFPFSYSEKISFPAAIIMPTEIQDEVIEAEIDTDDDDDNEDVDDAVVDINVNAVVEESEDDDDEEEADEDVVIAEDVEMEVDDDDDNEKDEDDEEELAAVVVAEVDDEGDADDNSVAVEAAAAIAIVAEPPKRKSASTKTSSSSKRTKPVSSKPPSTHTSSKQNVAANDTKKAMNNKKKRPSSGTTPGTSKATVADKVDEFMKSLPAKKVVAARDARSWLRESVSSLPLSMGDIQVLSFGQICIRSLPSSTSTPIPQAALLAKNPFHTATSLYPVGFSCDRYELSPVHGRILKMRCTILDGRSIKANQKFGGFPVQNDLPDGPVFRITWGRGIDEDTPGSTPSTANRNIEKVEYSFDPFAQSKPIVSTGSTKNDTLIMDAVKSTKRSSIIPKVGMRVKVFCEKDVYFPGTIATVNESKPVVTNGKKKRKRYLVMIHYDDGIKEEMTFPDPDIELLSPGK